MPGDFEILMYFEQNIDNEQFVYQTFKIPVCPLTTFIKNVNPPFFDGFSVELPTPEYHGFDSDPTCPIIFHLLDKKGAEMVQPVDYTYDGSSLTVSALGEYTYWWSMEDNPEIVTQRQKIMEAVITEVVAESSDEVTTSETSSEDSDTEEEE